MKIYKFDDEFYVEVVEDGEMSEDRNSYKVKVNRYISSKSPIFKYKDDSYIEISIGGWHRREEVSEKEFSKAIEFHLKQSWKHIFEIEKSSKGVAFMLTSLAVSTRDAYKKTHKLDWQGFSNYVHELRNEVMNGQE